MAQEPEEAPLGDEEEEGGPIKPFLEHLEDLRWVLIKCITALIVGMVICMPGAPRIIAFLTRPVPPQIRLEFFGPLDGFWVSMKLAFFGGLVLAFPFVLYVLMDFVLPALKKKERKYIVRALGVGIGMFLAGASLCYFVMLTISLRATVQFNIWLGIPTSMWRAQEYFSFVSWFIIGMGAAFELPVIVLTLVKLGIIEHRFLVKSRKYVFVINLVVCSFITPDFVTTFFMLVPMQILLESCIWISGYWERQKRLQEAALMASEPGHGSMTD
jgi:sec-independent protein translocase protein TatC